MFMIDWLIYLFIYCFIVFNATFSNISAISGWSVLVVEKAGVAGENHRPWASNWYHLRLRVECTLFVIYKTGREPMQIGLNELLGNPTT